MHKHIHRNRKTPSAPESLWCGRGFVMLSHFCTRMAEVGFLFQRYVRNWDARTTRTSAIG